MAGTLLGEVIGDGFDHAGDVVGGGGDVGFEAVALEGGGGDGADAGDFAGSLAVRALVCPGSPMTRALYGFQPSGIIPGDADGLH